jgi:leucyl-tRNA synthetase
VQKDAAAIGAINQLSPLNNLSLSASQLLRLLDNMKYNPSEIEAKWQQYWANNQTFAADNHSTKPKYYVLDMFPYPSGAGLHVGHPLGYIASDIYARFKRHKGFNVLHPQGYDSFGLPAEQYAIQTGQHPDKTTRENIARYREQLDKIGFSFDWSREVRTSNPEYYKWTQWIFIQLFNSWYNKVTDKAEDIATLVANFELEGNAKIQAVCDENIQEFTADQWKAMPKAEQEKILLQYRLTYLAETEVNWCPALGTVLANDEIVNGVSERGGYPVIRKKMTQWSMRISAYAERLLQGLNSIDWTDALKESQRNWIGKSSGASVKFQVTGNLGDTIADPEDPIIEVFTTRPDTIFGVSFLTLAPEHPFVQQITTDEQRDAVNTYVQATAKRSERDRTADVKTISGAFTGAYASHPLSGLPIPIWIGDYVLAGYGTGAVMAVPAGDQRDYDFAKHFHLEIENIFEGVDISEKAYDSKENVVLKNSDFLNGLDYKAATKKAISALEELKMGQGKTNYRLRDAVFSRQRYWGEPFPVFYKDSMPQMIEAQHLPIRLPEVEKYLPTEDGAPPLGNASVWGWDSVNGQVVSNDKIDNLDVFPLELNTMPGWAGSSWYWLRYMDPHNTDKFVSPEAEAYWENVDLYIGGSEHATGHLLYSRFWNKFLYDRGFVHFEEPFKKLINQGMILGTSAFAHRLEGTNTFVSKGKINGKKTQPIHADVYLVNASEELDVDGFKSWRADFANAEFITEDNGKFIVTREVEKMSKSKYNVVNPDDICNEYGADTLRLYEMFLGPLEQYKPWNTAGITGVFGFLKKLWRLYFDDNGQIVTSNPASKEALKILHKTIKKVEDDIEGFSFNTSVSQFMICVNELTAMNCHERAILEPLAIIISPYAPHIAEELWNRLGHEGSISNVPFPKFNPEHLVESSKEYPVSLNGKTKFFIELPLDLSKEQIEQAILKDERTSQMLDGMKPTKVIVVPGRIINIVP